MTSNRQFIAEAAALASANYPTWNPSAATLELWAVAMPELSGREFLDAMVSHIRNSPYQPTVSALLGRHRDLSLGAEVETPGILAWGEVHAAIKGSDKPRAPEGSGRSYWSHELTEQALHALGGWVSVLGCQSSQISSMRSRFCEAFDGLAKLQEQEEERVAVAQIVGGSGPLLTDGTGGDKTTRELE
jgi:hypothetical protein